MTESATSQPYPSGFPRSTNRLLSPSEKVFIDRFPDELVKAVFEFDDANIKATVMTPSGVEAQVFNGEKATAVRDYFEMQFAYGIRKDPRE